MQIIASVCLLVGWMTANAVRKPDTLERLPTVLIANAVTFGVVGLLAYLARGNKNDPAIESKKGLVLVGSTLAYAIGFAASYYVN